MSISYYLMIDGMESGPFSEVEVFEIVHSGSNKNKQFKIRKDSTEDWMDFKEEQSLPSLWKYSASGLQSYQVYYRCRGVRPLITEKNRVMFFFGVMAALYALTAVLGYFLAQGDPETISGNMGMAHGILIATVPLFILFFLGGSICFLVWFYRAAGNAAAMARFPVSHRPGAAVGWFFLPIANLFMPYLVMNMVYNISEKPDDSSYKKHHAGIIIWWLLFIFFIFEKKKEQIAIYVTPNIVISIVKNGFLEFVVFGAAVYYLLALVRKVTRLQSEYYLRTKQ